MAGYLDLLDFAKDTSVDIVNGTYDFNLADGVYEDNCENNGGKLKLTVSNKSSQMLQEYSNCQISVTDNSGTQRVTLSGEEKITINQQENSYSTFSLQWKKYSLSFPGEAPITFNGQFSYEGLLHFDRTIIYENIRSKIKIDATIADGKDSFDMRNVALNIDFPSLFEPTLPVYFQPKGTHVLHQKMLSASGEFQFKNSAAVFQLNTAGKKITFSGATTAKAIIDYTQYGFFLRWDENGDNQAEANIFLTENEYPFIIDNLNSSINPIYFTRYPNVYNTPYPKNHWATGVYERVNLSKGGTAEIDVQEFFTTVSGSLLSYEINGERESKDWEQISAGKFILKFPDADSFELIELKITATDSFGNRSPTLTAKVQMNDNLADFDKDGIPDYQDRDMDNDGTFNDSDRFPKDPTEQSDLDGDGIGDNSDGDKDNDETENANDAYPADGSCSKQESGDGTSCYLTNSSYEFTDKNGIAYFIQRVEDSTFDGKSRFIRFDTISKRYLDPTPSFNSPSSSTFTYAYNEEKHSVVIVSRTSDSSKIVHDVSILYLENFTFKPIENSRNYEMSPMFYDYGYLIFSVAESTWSGFFLWIEVYDSTGKLISTSENEARAAPKDQTYLYLQHSRGVPFCGFSVSVNNLGNIIKNGQYENRYRENCTIKLQVSENGLYGFAYSDYSIALYNTNQGQLWKKSGLEPAWIGNKILHTETGTYNLILTSYPSNESAQLDGSLVVGSSAFASGKNILLMKLSSYQSPARLQIYSEDLQLIYDSKQF